MADNQPILNVVGQKVALGPLRRDLLPTYQRWINDFEVTVSTGKGWAPVTDEAEQAWFDRITRGPTDVSFTIYEGESRQPIGCAGLHQIDLGNRTAEFGIMIGEKACWGRGYGTEATALVLDYGFNALSLHNILLRAYEFNQRGLRAYHRAGFREIGRRREARLIGGRYYDVVYMDCLSTEFTSPCLQALLPFSSA